MDYWNGTVPDAYMTMAIAMLPATVPVTDPRYGGPILINPGGPGGSGVSIALARAKALQMIVDSPGTGPGSQPASEARHFDIVGFDPRGIGASLPRADCFYSEDHRSPWIMRRLEDGLFTSSDAATGRIWSKAHALGESCKAFTEEGGSGEDVSIMKYITTASVSRDMLEFVERYGEWREQHAARLIEEHHLDSRLLDALAHRKDQEQLQFWGFSYGSFLGQTFASMYPDRVGRVIVDGIVDTQDYINGIWANSMDETNKTMRSFYTLCAEAGPSGCALANSTSTADSIEESVEAFISSLYHMPFVPTNDQPDILSWSVLKDIIFSALYSPNVLFPVVAELLHSLMNGDGHEILPILETLHSYSCPLPNDGLRLGPNEAQQGIACGDAYAHPNVNATFEEFQEFVQDLAQKAPAAGGIWPEIRLNCVAWRIRALYSYRGPFGGKTQTPLLFISNTADPVTGLAAGRRMVKTFEDAGLIVQDSPGHCSISAFSACTVTWIRRYLRTGDVPMEELPCSAEQIPFQDFDLTTLSADDIQAYEAHRDIAQAFHEQRLGFGRPLLGI
jgi:pimeloyl-ACP methyl ester carboxylesterase